MKNILLQKKILNEINIHDAFMYSWNFGKSEKSIWGWLYKNVVKYNYSQVGDYNQSESRILQLTTI